VAAAGSAPSRALVVQQRRGTQMKRARLPRKDLERFGILDSTFGASGRNHWPPAHAEVSSGLEDGSAHVRLTTNLVCLVSKRYPVRAALKFGRLLKVLSLLPTSNLRIIYCGARKRHNGCYAAMRGRYALWRYV